MTTSYGVDGVLVEYHSWAVSSGVGAAAIDGKIIAVGGYDGVEQLDSVEEYDPAEEQWRFLSPLKYQRSYIGVVKTLKMV